MHARPIAPLSRLWQDLCPHRQALGKRRRAVGINAAQLESLEPRVLLSTGFDAAGNANPPVDLPARSVVSVEWAGREVEAAADEWIIRFDVDSDPEQLLDTLGRRGIAAKGIRPLSAPGFGVLSAPFAAAEGLQRWAAQQEQVSFIEPNFVLEVEQVPDDPNFENLWGLHNTGQSGGVRDADIDAPEAWELTTGSRDVVIAVIDTGIDYTHPDLSANIWSNGGEIVGDGIDNDGNGFIDDVRGWDFANDDADPMDDHRHGTHVAGTIGARGNDGRGVTGVNWNIQLMPVKFIAADGWGLTSDAVDAVNYVTMMKRDHGVNIVATNNSWGGGDYSLALREAILASGEQEILFVAAAGNDGANNDQLPMYPSSYDLDNIISVAATDHRDELAYFSNYGQGSVDIAAPGVNIYSTFYAGLYGYASGTSMAAPHVAGVAGLLAAFDPNISAAEIKQYILEGADSVAGLAGKVGTGARLNAAGALAAYPSVQVSGVVFEDLDGDGQRDSVESGMAGVTVFLDLDGDGLLNAGGRTFYGSEPVQPHFAPLLDVNVMVDITHPNMADLSLALWYSNYNGERDTVNLVFRGDGLGADFAGTTFDDEAEMRVADASAPYTGSFQPRESLSTFDGMSGDGVWALLISNWGDDEYTLNDWSLTLNGPGSEPTAVTAADGSYSFTNLLPGEYRVAQVLPPGYAQILPDTLVHSAAAGRGDVVVADFGNQLSDNQPPQPVDDHVIAAEDITLRAGASLLANDVDPEGEPLVARLTRAAEHGKVTLYSDGTFRYLSDPEYSGSDTFSYEAVDRGGNATEATVFLTVEPTNDAPVAADDYYSVNQNSQLVVSAPGVLANDEDIDSDTLTASFWLSDGVEHGSLTVRSDGGFTYTPNPGYVGVDSFTYRASDGGASAPATVYIQVNPALTAPTDLSASASGASAVALTWSDNTALEDGYHIERSAKPKGKHSAVFERIATVGVDATGYLDDDAVLAGGEWLYRVQAYNASGATEFSNTAQVSLKGKGGGDDGSDDGGDDGAEPIPGGEMYVWDITWSTRQRGRNTDLQLAIDVNADSDADSIAESSDDPAADVLVTIRLTYDANGDGVYDDGSWTHESRTGSDGLAQFQIKNALAGNYKVEVIDLQNDALTWNPALNEQSVSEYIGFPNGSEISSSRLWTSDIEDLRKPIFKLRLV